MTFSALHDDVICFLVYGSVLCHPCVLTVLVVIAPPSQRAPQPVFDQIDRNYIIIPLPYPTTTLTILIATFYSLDSRVSVSFRDMIPQ